MAALMQYVNLVPQDKNTFLFGGEVQIKVTGLSRCQFLIPGAPAEINVQFGDIDDMLGIPRKVTIDGKNVTKALTLARRHIMAVYRKFGCADTKTKQSGGNEDASSNSFDPYDAALARMEKSYQDKLVASSYALTKHEENRVNAALELFRETTMTPHAWTEISSSLFGNNAIEGGAMVVSVTTALAWQADQLHAKIDANGTLLESTNRQLQESEWKNEALVNRLQQQAAENHVTANQMTSLNTNLSATRQELALSRAEMAKAETEIKKARQTIIALQRQGFFMKIGYAILGMLLLFNIATISGIAQPIATGVYNTVAVPSAYAAKTIANGVPYSIVKRDEYENLRADNELLWTKNTEQTETINNQRKELDDYGQDLSWHASYVKVLHNKVKALEDQLRAQGKTPDYSSLYLQALAETLWLGTWRAKRGGGNGNTKQRSSSRRRRSKRRSSSKSRSRSRTKSKGKVQLQSRRRSRSRSRLRGSRSG